MGYDPVRPYNDLPLLPPKADLETRAVLKKAVSAHRALAELKGLGRTIPNQDILINSLTLLESKDSSGIENIVTTSDSLFKAFAADTVNTDTSTKEVLRYREALWSGYKALKDKPFLTTNLFISLVQQIKKNSSGIRNTPGTVLTSAADGAVVYSPPEGEIVIRDKLKNLEDFIHAEDDLDILVKLAVMHYQFEAIHPFSDGNGRTGRIINILYLVLKGLLDAPVLYLSREILRRRNEYYRLLRGVTGQGDWEPWILYMLEAVEATADFTRRKMETIRTLMDETAAKAKKELPARVYSKELIELLFRQPYCKIAFLVEEGIASRNIASDYLSHLEKIGIVKKEILGRERLYLNVGLYDILAANM